MHGSISLHLTPLCHYLMLSTCLFQICGIAYQSAHYFIFLPSILLLPICCPLWVLSFSDLIESGSHHQSVSEPSSCALNNVINTNSKNTVFLTGEVLVCSFLSLCCSYRKSFTFPSFCGLCRTPQVPQVLFPHRQLLSFQQHFIVHVK